MQPAIPLTYKGKTQTLKEWASETGIPFSVLNRRRYLDWTPDEIIETPIKRYDNLKWQGQSWSIRGLAKHIGMPHSTLARRLQTGMTLDEAVTTPITKGRGKPITVEWNGEKRKLKELSAEFYQRYATVTRRLKDGCDLRESLTLGRVYRPRHASVSLDDHL